MRSTWKAVVVTGALAFCQVILIGLPGRATAAILNPEGILLPGFDLVNPLNNPAEFNFADPDSGDVFSFAASTDPSGLISFGGVGPRVGPRGQEFSFLGGSDISFGGVGPRPLPHGDVPGGTALVFASDGNISLGGVTPRPGPPKDEGFFLNLPVILGGTIDLYRFSDVDAVHFDGDKVPIFVSPFAFSGSLTSETENWTIFSARIFVKDWQGFTFPLEVLYAEYEAPAPVPEPSTMLLLGSGLVGLAGRGMRRFRKTGSKMS